MRIRQGFICVAVLEGGDRTFFGEGDEGMPIGDAYATIRENDLRFFESREQADSAKRAVIDQFAFAEVFVGLITLKIAETMEEAHEFESLKSARFVVIARTFNGPDLVGTWMKSTATWSFQAGNSMRENGMLPFTRYEKAVECAEQICRQTGGKEPALLATYSFRRCD